MGGMWRTIRQRDGLVCSRPTDFRRAEGLALYLMAVTGEQYTVVPFLVDGEA